MSKGRLSILIIPPSTGRVKQYSVPQWIGRAVIAAAITLLVATLTSMGLATYGLSRAQETNGKVQENEALRATLVEVTGDLNTLRQQLARLEHFETAVRQVFGFPEIPSEERALGTGGGVGPTEIAAGLSDQLVFQLETEMDQLLRRSQFERDNYDDVLGQLIGRKTQLDHTPSIFPVNGYLSRGFGVKPDPFTGCDRMHTGLDLSARMGTPVYAPASGKVILREFQTQFGNMIAIDHGYGLETCFGHLSKYTVKLNQTVRRGDIIGYVGNTGYSTGPHLHYEVRVRGQAVNPMKYVYDRAPQTEEPLTAASTSTL